MQGVKCTERFEPNTVLWAFDTIEPISRRSVGLTVDIVCCELATSFSLDFCLRSIASLLAPLCLLHRFHSFCRALPLGVRRSKQGNQG